MALTFHKLTMESKTDFETYGALRPMYTAEGQFMNQFIWADYYNAKYALTEQHLFFLMTINNELATMMPYCRKEDIIDGFFEIKDYFNETLHCPLKMYIVDEPFLDVLNTSNRFRREFTVKKHRDCFDYIYDANKLRTLSGKAYHKKKNHLNSFIKKMDGRFSYQGLNATHIPEIKEFHQNWLEQRTLTERQDCVEGEEDGLMHLLDNFSSLPCKIGGVYIDDVLEAYTIGSYNTHLETAFIHIEKANVSINGLYNYINQQFLIHEFPDAIYVNREDDLGQEGLRKSKLSYNPIRLEAKYNIFEI